MRLLDHCSSISRWAPLLFACFNIGCGVPIMIGTISSRRFVPILVSQFHTEPTERLYNNVGYLWGACSLSRDYTGCGVLAVAKQSRMPAASRCQLCCGGLARCSHALRRADWKIRSGCSAPGLCALPRQPGLARRPKIGSRCRAPKAAIDLIDQCSLRPRSTELGRRERGAAESARAEPRDERRRAVEGEGVVSTSVVPCGAPLARCLASSGPLSGVARRWRGLPLSLYIVPKTSTNTKSKRQNQNSRAPSGTATLTLSRQHRTRHSSQDGSRHRTRHTPRVRAEILLILTYTVLLSCRNPRCS